MCLIVLKCFYSLFGMFFGIVRAIKNYFLTYLQCIWCSDVRVIYHIHGHDTIAMLWGNMAYCVECLSLGRSTSVRAIKSTIEHMCMFIDLVRKLHIMAVKQLAALFENTFLRFFSQTKNVTFTFYRVVADVFSSATGWHRDTAGSNYIRVRQCIRRAKWI